MHVLFGKTRIPYFVLSSILVLLQSAIFNEMMLRSKAFGQSTYIPAFFFALCMNAFFDFMTLSPILMSMTFILLAMNNLFRRMDNSTKDELFVFTGIHLGIATLFYLPNFLFLFVTFVSLLLFTGSIARRMLLLLLSYFVVLALCSLYYYWYDAAGFYHEFFYFSLWSLPTVSYIDKMDELRVIAVPSAILVFAGYKMIQLGKYINFQVRIQRVMLFNILAGIFSLLITDELTTFQFIWFVPSIAFFLTHLVMTLRFWLFSELAAGVVVILLLFNNIFALKGWFFVADSSIYSDLFIQTNNTSYRDQNIWVIDERPDAYLGAKLGTPFVNWHLSKELITGMNYYDNMTRLHKVFEQQKPAIIIDKKEVMEDILYRLPVLADQYRQQGRGIYKLVD